jgi:hypothetical protein
LSSHLGFFIRISLSKFPPLLLYPGILCLQLVQLRKPKSGLVDWLVNLRLCLSLFCGELPAASEETAESSGEVASLPLI